MRQEKKTKESDYYDLKFFKVQTIKKQNPLILNWYYLCITIFKMYYYLVYILKLLIYIWLTNVYSIYARALLV